jgi:3-hydroxyisobutyrate dehydrogenase-like beta-hydroxyacid dehydrogenase
MNIPVTVSMLGLGEMGRALASALLRDDRSVIVWNRTPGKGIELIQAGAVEAATVADAIDTADLIVVCLLDHASVHNTLDPVVDRLRNRTLINLTTTSPEEARELGRWAVSAGVTYVDGGIMAVPSMIAGPGSEILYSGDEKAFRCYKELLDTWGASTYLGSDTGLASLYDLALLAGMYVMFAGYLQGAALVRTAGVSATDFAGRAAPWISAMTNGLADFGRVIDGGDYTVSGQQSLDFSDLSTMLDVAAQAGVGAQPVAMVQRLIAAERNAGHGTDGFARIFESIANPTA